MSWIWAKPRQMVLARELGADWVTHGREKRTAQTGADRLARIGTVGVLLKSKQAGLLHAIRPDLERLRQQGFTIGQFVVDTVLEQAGE